MKNILNAKVLILMFLFSGFLLCISLAYILVIRPSAPPPDLTPASADLAITAGPTSTQRILPPTLTPFPPTPTTSPTPAPGEFAIGVYVQITKTGDEGLNIRSEAGLNTKVLFSGRDSEVFLIAAGPVQADGYTWWRLTASYDATRAGWAAQNFLTVISSH
jgi:hypothetical protein